MYSKSLGTRTMRGYVVHGCARSRQGDARCDDLHVGRGAEIYRCMIHECIASFAGPLDDPGPAFKTCAE